MSTNNRKFLHTLTPASASLTGCQTYQVAGADWNGHGREATDSHDWLSHHPADGVILEIRRDYQGDGFLWEWSLLIAKGVYARHTAVEDSIEAAAAAAIAYAPRVLTFDYLNESTWYETAEGNFFAAIEGESAAITKRASSFHWARHWAPAKTLKESLHGYASDEIEGTAPTVEAAMIACIEAPYHLKAACGALIANLRAASLATGVATRIYSDMLYRLADQIDSDEGCVTESSEAVRRAAERLDLQTLQLNVLKEKTARGPLDTCAKHTPAVAPVESEGGDA